MGCHRHEPQGRCRVRGRGTRGTRGPSQGSTSTMGDSDVDLSTGTLDVHLGRERYSPAVALSPSVPES